MGGVTTGGFDTTKPSLFHDGLVLPPMLAFRDDKPVKSVLRMFFDNTRFPAVIVPDIMAIAATLRFGESRLRDSIERYGIDAFFGAITYACDASAEAMRDALAALPDGDYVGEELLDTDSLPNSEPYRVKVTVIKRGSKAEFDFSGTSLPSRSALNSAWPDTKTAVTLALTCLVAPEARFTSASRARRGRRGAPRLHREPAAAALDQLLLRAAADDDDGGLRGVEPGARARRRAA